MCSLTPSLPWIPILQVIATLITSYIAWTAMQVQKENKDNAIRSFLEGRVGYFRIVDIRQEGTDTLFVIAQNMGGHIVLESADDWIVPVENNAVTPNQMACDNYFHEKEILIDRDPKRNPANYGEFPIYLSPNERIQMIFKGNINTGTTIYYRIQFWDIKQDKKKYQELKGNAIAMSQFGIAKEIEVADANNAV